ncbi:D-alanyl-D-alanine carboxypeptidase/D-alanyl-D-alanine-endopeptidase [Chitinophagaceae bacterium LB-8]|uniref:D-alanyl-D-alanine carboxypeptidase/D-alanyl-D-alanine-endopeptidase n=1 Tax=Paraflavisolibacter caeni TaxID=2982496 RepID=A0A9X2XPA3_9BACT|nr:D-alanyl-D-alanine carboxypeptidase/D-alanyl-D-alanine-endopeptidase [Paraflavisolibacter caeni]MCU7550798.1 D-alanyl-D-alanine carboxypeptidase/D-alanyl-D-alanine-endopeptidase [Paraflavisolibacter caeni]
MKNGLLIFVTFCFFVIAEAQSVSARLSKSFQQFESDLQLRNGISSLYVLDGVTGEVIFEKNASVGLMPASTQKIITSATAYELLGKDYRYITDISFSGNKASGKLKIKASGDPALGSWRWPFTKESVIVDQIVKSVGRQSIQNIEEIVVDVSGWEIETIPDGWIVQDIGNYYGAGSEALNWRENQFDLVLRSGTNVGDSVQIIESNPKLIGYNLESYVSTAPKGSGDNAYIYFPLQSGPGMVRGTIPVGENRFVISGAFPSAGKQFTGTLKEELKKSGKANNAAVVFMNKELSQYAGKSNEVLIWTHVSPTLDSLIYWLNKKSINLYAETLLKTISLQKNGLASRTESIELLKKFWQQKGIPVTELNIVDGSGLSPLNRVTSKAQVIVLQYAQKQPWFNGFYNSLPEYNDMRMKSGTMSGVKGFTGYHKSKDGRTYIFSFLVNNFNGPSSSLVQKMYKVLNELK